MILRLKLNAFASTKNTSVVPTIKSFYDGNNEEKFIGTAGMDEVSRR
jgi:hypothetical protein